MFKKNKKTIKILEDEILNDLKRILENTNTTNFEKEKVSIAINLIEKGTPISNVLRRLQITFVGKTQSPEVKLFNKNITQYLRDSQILGTAFMGSALPL
ncbi:hypothetical protein [Lactococcus ileimucosae]|uniref:hypothetical protein n=1 Tax=Lactococcus ileimucosae TaxID=2941329 RepID=UPI003519460A